MVVRVFAPRVLRFRCFRSSSRSGGSASPRVVARSSWPERCLARHIAGSFFSCSIEFLLVPMNILQVNPFGYTYVDDNGDHFSVVDNSECNAPNDVYPLMLGPFQDFMAGFDESCS